MSLYIFFIVLNNFKFIKFLSFVIEQNKYTNNRKKKNKKKLNGTKCQDIYFKYLYFKNFSFFLSNLFMPLAST